jgi:hypothetical protein
MIPINFCLSCGERSDAATHVGNEEATPIPGDITVCLYCGHVMAFGTELELRELTKDEAYMVAGDKRILAVQRARAKHVQPRWKQTQ